MTSRPPTKRRDEPKVAPMSDEARAARNAYLRSYRKANPERVSKWNATYWQRRAERTTADSEGEVNDD